MHITRLRLLGFKSFVEPADLLIERGLTGVVGPNGCGKSNLLEALRWVMGETSHKSMRAAAMDDVIFAGTNTRPARNAAEVTIFLDNSARKAPHEFNDRDVIEITRRIEREAGSAYRINGTEARARDVKLLFEDAATGARSPSLVRQGQIGEIVNAKPENRRRILEDAAGVAGLHSRRHEAELRLRAAEGNLARLRDLMGQLSSQLEALKRQARAAKRYKELSVEIRRTEALYFHVTWLESHASVEREETALRAVLSELAAATTDEAAALRTEAELAETLDPLREEEAVRAAILARLRHQIETFEAEAARQGERERDLKARAGQTARDIAREEDLLEESTVTLVRLQAEWEMIATGDAGHDDADESARAKLTVCESAQRAAEASLTALTNRAAEARAQKKSLESSLTERRDAISRIKRLLETLAAETAAVAARAPDAITLAELQTHGQQIAARLQSIESETADAEADARAKSVESKAARESAAKLRLDANALHTERETLAKLLIPAQAAGLPPVVDQIRVAAGLETALGAALGDDLEATLDHSAPIHWRHLDTRHAGKDPPLPEGVEPLLGHIEAPPALTRRLAQIGFVSREQGHRLQTALKPGQRLVTREGDLWRWDGFIAAADGATPAALRLAERNRLDGLTARARAAIKSAENATAAETASAAAFTNAEQRERSLREEWRSLLAELSKTRDKLNHLERAARETDSRLGNLADSRERAADDMVDAHSRHDELALALSSLDEDGDLTDALRDAETHASRVRAATMEARAAATALIRERQLRRERHASVRDDLARWAARQTAASAQIEQLRARLPDIRAELATLADLPAQIANSRQKLLDELTSLERQRDEAAHKLASADAALKSAVLALKSAQGLVGQHRESRARLEARLEAARNRRAEDVRKSREALELDPPDCLALAAHPQGSPLPVPADADRALSRLKSDRDRLGGVNLTADDELEKIDTQVAGMTAEIADVEGAINKLRGAIGQINREARKRLQDAFTIVDGHFRRLFTTLFNGGEARLELIESDDPLEGGLEIIAKPPGKKPATLSLLSGGEQTLTALSLIFAVFLTNPSPICVLDEVDAPLDDSNVDRFCLLMEKMAAETDTRFLVITHHPVTMSRTNRLFGVTMAEKGISQLVSVDLETAVRFQEAG